ncbi:hypothetical protein C8Q70DRAFT_992727 [Cubamyces menziesii]|nr:hypothetical protein C8Q70DRAFT_992727 [Cubamyces menziesii]
MQMGAYKLSQVFRCSTSCSPPTPFVAFSPSLFWRNFGHIEVIAKCVQDQRKPRYLWWEGPASSRAIGKKAMPERRNQTEGDQACLRTPSGRRWSVDSNRPYPGTLPAFPAFPSWHSGGADCQISAASPCLGACMRRDCHIRLLSGKAAAKQAFPSSVPLRPPVDGSGI